MCIFNTDGDINDDDHLESVSAGNHYCLNSFLVLHVWVHGKIKQIVRYCMMSKWHTYQSSCLSVQVTIAENSLMYSIHQKSNTIELTVIYYGLCIMQHTWKGKQRHFVRRFDNLSSLFLWKWKKEKVHFFCLWNTFLRV
jgi:hypothetical protein